MRSWVIAALLCVATASQAGQLHIQAFGLKEARESGATIVLGKVTATRGEKRAQEIDVLVERVWAGTNQVGQAQVGATRTYTLDPGVEWKDPHKSPIERRRRGAAGGAAVGDRVIVVPADHGGVQLLAATEQVQKRADILYAPDPAARLAKEDDAFLKASLDELDLAKLAADELQRRGKLDTRSFLLGDRHFTDKAFHEMKPADQERVVREGIALARKDKALRDRLATLVWYQPVRALVPSLYPIVAMYSFEDKEDARRLDDIRLQLVILDHEEGPLDLDAYVEFLEKTMRFRPRYRTTDKDFPKLTARLTAPKKTQLAALLIQNAHKPADVSKDDKYDAGMLWEGVRLAEEAPAPELVPLLATLDPSAPRVLSTKQGVMDAIITVATAVARKHAGQKDKVRDVVEPWLERAIPVEEKLLDEYRNVVGEGQLAPPVEESVELRPGERRRFKSGFHVSYRKTSDGAYEVELGQGRGPTTAWMLEPKDDWYREWWEAPYLVFSKRIVGTDRIKLRFVPHQKEPPTASDADLTEQAEKIAKRRGCNEDPEHDYDEQQGRFIYRSKDRKGTRCMLVIGGRTRNVVRFVP